VAISARIAAATCSDAFRESSELSVMRRAYRPRTHRSRRRVAALLYGVYGDTYDSSSRSVDEEEVTRERPGFVPVVSAAPAVDTLALPPA
jgi:hypothetical protein